MFRAVHGSVVLYPCDANQTAALVAAWPTHRGIGYLRTTRGNTPVIYRAGRAVPGRRQQGAARQQRDDQVTIIAAGITVHEALAAADALAADGIAARVIDLYSVKPVDTQTLREAAEVTEHFVTVEDHCPEGGLGDAVLAAFANGFRPPAVTKLAVHTMPGSATPEEQLHARGHRRQGHRSRGAHPARHGRSDPIRARADGLIPRCRERGTRCCVPPQMG